MARPHAAAVLEDAWHRQLSGVLSRRGWQTRIVPHTGYGAEGFVRVLGRVLLTRRPRLDAAADAAATPEELEVAAEEQRGWRAFVTVPAMNEPVTLRVGNHVVHGYSDRSGLIDLTVRNHELPAGWHQVGIESPKAESTTATVFVVGSEERFGLVSDIDDTVIKTFLPRPMIAAWNTFVSHEGSRKPVDGMAYLYRTLLAEHPNAPIVYVSTGAWNTAPHLTRFLKRHGFPLGPLLLTDWGPTNTGWFRSGQEHKRACLHRLARELPQVRWVLVGDDGQHDPKLYGEFATQRPDVVEAIAIRELTPAEQVLSHGLPVSNEEIAPRRGRSDVPVCRAPDGHGLLRLLHVALGRHASA